MPEHPPLLLIDDHPARAATLAGALRRADYAVVQTADGPTALLLAAQVAPALILLNMRLPDWRSLELFAGLRGQSSTPIVLFGDGRGGGAPDWDFPLGPDDHLVQVRCPDDLVGQVQALARTTLVDRETPPTAPLLAGPGMIAPSAHSLMRGRLISGNLTLHLAARWVQRAGARITLKPRVFTLLLCFMQHPGQVLSRPVLLAEVWGHAPPGGVRTVDVHVHWLRAKLEPAPHTPQIIQTVPRLGYCWIPPVVYQADPTAAAEGRT